MPFSMSPSLQIKLCLSFSLLPCIGKLPALFLLCFLLPVMPVSSTVYVEHCFLTRISSLVLFSIIDQFTWGLTFLLPPKSLSFTAVGCVSPVI